MTQPKFGKLVEPGDAAKRDAIHIATITMIAGETLRPGQHVGMADEDVLKHAYAAVGQRHLTVREVGIVDPYLRRPVLQGQRFWLFLYPETVTSLRHEWTHPAWPT